MYTKEEMLKLSREEFIIALTASYNANEELREKTEALERELQVANGKSERAVAEILKSLILEFASPTEKQAWRIKALKYSTKELAGLLHSTIEGHKVRADMLWDYRPKIPQKEMFEMHPERFGRITVNGRTKQHAH